MTELKRLDYSVLLNGKISIEKKDFDEMIARIEKLDKEVTELCAENEQLQMKIAELETISNNAQGKHDYGTHAHYYFQLKDGISKRDERFPVNAIVVEASIGYIFNPIYTSDQVPPKEICAWIATSPQNQV